MAGLIFVYAFTLLSILHAVTDRHSLTAKINLNWRKENHTLCVPIWRNLKFHIRRRFIFHIGVRYKTIRIIYTLSEMWDSCMESYKMLKRNFYNNFYMAVSQNLTKPYYFLLAKSAKANWIWLEFFTISQNGYSVSLLRVTPEVIHNIIYKLNTERCHYTQCQCHQAIQCSAQVHKKGICNTAFNDTQLAELQQVDLFST